MSTISQDEIHVRVERRLSKARWVHTLGVAETAERLAVRHGGDPEAARLAGLLHDYAREMPPVALLRSASEYGLAVDEVEAREPLLLHGKVGAALVRDGFALEDSCILAAIASHITGEPGMGLLQQLVFLADFIEPGRSYPAAATARLAALDDLPHALSIVFDAVIAHVISRGYLLHPRTVAARNELLML